MNRSWKSVSGLLAAGATAGGILFFHHEESAVAAPQPKADARADDTPVLEVKPGKLHLAVEEWGLLEATRNQDVMNQVEGQTVIISIVPEGTRVTRGQLVCELDSAPLKDLLNKQQIATAQAEASFQQSRLAHEVAEVAVKEFEEGTYPGDRQSVKKEITAAEAAIKKSEDRRDRILRARRRLNDLLAAKGEDRTASEIVAEIDLDDRAEDVSEALSRAKSALEQARTREDVLEKFEGPRRLAWLRSEVEKARSNELARRSNWEAEKAREAKLGRQIASCRILAPGDGVVVYANDPNRFGGPSGPQIEEGAMVRERQKIFSLPVLSGPMRVNVKVPESMIEWLTPGLRARIKVEGFADEALPGVIQSIAPLPDQSTYFGRGIKVYTTYVAIEKGPVGLNPGMTAQVEILTGELENVLSVPARSVVYYDRKDHVAVKKPDNGFEWRELTLGLSTGTMVEVKQGLRSGESVAIEPASLLNGGQKLKISLSPPRPAPRPRRPVDIFSPASMNKLRALDGETRTKLRGASPEEREAVLRKAGFTDDEIRQFNQFLPRAGAPPRP